MSVYSKAILLTPPGSAAIAVVRLVGVGVLEFLQKHFSKTAKPGKCTHGKFRDEQGEIDDPIVVLYHPQKADVNLHGGPWVVQAFLDLCRSAHFAIFDHLAVIELIRSALRTKFQSSPERVADADITLADLFDTDDLIEQETLAGLQLATTELATRELLRQPAAWRELTHLPEVEKKRHAQEMLTDYGMVHLLVAPRVAIVGAPNVGKSTLANQLFGQEKSIVADMPGTTRDWVGEFANIDGLSVLLVDTPGIRQTVDVIEEQAIVQAGKEAARCDLVIVVLDASRECDAEEKNTMAQFGERGIVVANKCDLAKRWEPDANMIAMNARTGDGLEFLCRAISGRFGIRTRENLARCWTIRQAEMLRLIAACGEGPF